MTVYDFARARGFRILEARRLDDGTVRVEWERNGAKGVITGKNGDELAWKFHHRHVDLIGKERAHQPRIPKPRAGMVARTASILGLWLLRMAVRRSSGRLRRASKPGRNSACYCGSGRKFKRCHGSASLQAATETAT